MLASASATTCVKGWSRSLSRCGLLLASAACAAFLIPRGPHKRCLDIMQAGDLGAAVEVFEDLKSAGLAPNKVTYCALISALGKDRRRGVRSAQLAYELWTELQGQGEQLDAAAYRTGTCWVSICQALLTYAEPAGLIKRTADALVCCRHECMRGGGARGRGAGAAQARGSGRRGA